MHFHTMWKEFDLILKYFCYFNLDENDSVKYKITDVSNGGKRAFYVNPNTGDLEVIGAVEAGESYRITVTAKLVTFIVTNSKSLVGNLRHFKFGTNKSKFNKCTQRSQRIQ